MAALACWLRCVPQRRQGTALRLLSPSSRCFSYEDTLAFRLHGPKPLAIVIHPVLPGHDHQKGHGRPWQQVIWDAEEALGLARANRWDLLPGPNGEPYGGWDHEALLDAERTELRRRYESGAWNVPEGWHRDRGDAESDDEYDVNEASWKNGVVKRQWAETCIIKVRGIDPNTYFGRGKVQELALYVAKNPCDFVYVNTALTPTQIRNLEVLFNNSVVAADTQTRREEGRLCPRGRAIPQLEVIDRNRLVLDIFSLRAKTPQAKLQVGLARLQYMKSRLVHGARGRLKETLKVLQEQIGPFHEVSGFGSNVITQYHYETTPFQTERNLLKVAEESLKKRIAVEERTKKLQQSGREGVPKIGIVGYTNAGKTSLMNRLTDAGLKERDLLFQTLETTLRRVRLPSGGHAIIADSIGFIQHLPHNLFSAFRSTLEDLTSCDILLHVRDISHPQRQMHKDIVLKTLQSAGIAQQKLDSATIEVWNKIDLLPAMDYVPPEAVPICAADGTGVEDLLLVMDTVIASQVSKQRRTVIFPRARMTEALAFLHKNGAVDEDTLLVPEGAEASVEAILPAVAWLRWRTEFPEVGQRRVIQDNSAYSGDSGKSVS